MSNDVRTFRAASMQLALRLVREEMGADAVILHTRQVSQRRYLPWQKAKQEVEITAGTGVNIRTQTRTASAVKAPPKPRVSPAESIVAAQHSTPAVERPMHAASAVPLVGQAVASSSRTATPPAPSAPPAAVAPPAPIAPLVPPAPPRSTPVAQSDPNAVFAEQLESIHKMIEHLSSTKQRGPGDEIPAELFELYTNLIDADVEDELARELVFRLKRQASAEQLGDTATSTALMTGMVEADIETASPIQPVPGRRKVVALVGPTGVGKTTTIAKLAANFRLRDGVRMGLVTVDTYRVAAVEQLRTYAEIIDLPMKVVTSPPEMRRALDELNGLDLILIDTAGRSPRDELKIQELKSLLAEAHVDEVHLVLSLAASVRSLQATTEKFAPANATSMILTKLDEAPGMGTLLSAARKVPLPISYLTTGQDVPDDIESAHPTRMARLILGQETIFE